MIDRFQVRSCGLFQILRQSAASASAPRSFRVAHAPRVLVSAPRRNELCQGPGLPPRSRSEGRKRWCKGPRRRCTGQMAAGTGREAAEGERGSPPSERIVLRNSSVLWRAMRGKVNRGLTSRPYEPAEHMHSARRMRKAKKTPFSKTVGKTNCMRVEFVTADAWTKEC